MKFVLFFAKIFLLNLWLPYECMCSNIANTLKELSHIFSPSGFEDDMRNFLIKKWKDACREVHVDNLGNVFFCINCTLLDKTKPVVVVAVHMDEVGLIVKSITDDGFIRFEPLGGWLEVAVILQKWVIKTPRGNVVGVSGFESAHVCNKYPSVPIKPMGKMFIDVGARSKKEAEDMGVRPGLGIAPYPTFEIIGLNSKRILSKALDDRIGLAVLNDVIDSLKGKSLDINLIVVCTVQEEVGMRGAKAIAGTIKPDIIISIDTSMSADFPLQVADSDGSTTKLGEGFSFFVFDGSMIPDQRLLNYLKDFADKNNMKYQYDAMPLYGHDASAMQQCFNGVASINIGIPCRYTHSGNSIIDLDDAQQTEKFLVELFSKMRRTDVERIINKRESL